MTPAPVSARRIAGHCPPGRSGFSLTELLVASSIALIVMAAIANLFGVFSRAMSQSQSTIDLSARMRSAAWQLRKDLSGVTCEVVPWLSPEADAGYFEVIEGPRRDSMAGDGSANLEADTDDILLFTTRSLDGSFVGRHGNETIESPYAEIAWFCKEAADQPVVGTTLYDLHRRQFLVTAYVGTTAFIGNMITGTLPNIDYDLSLRQEGTRLVPNSLGDLTKRENRFNRPPNFPPNFPFAFRVDGQARPPSNATFENTPRDWEDVVLTNVIAFDVRVFDPQARAQTTATTTLLPGDPGYGGGNAGYGAFIDLGSGQGGVLAGPPSQKSQLSLPTYDTWSTHYESNGIDDDRQGGPDQGADGIDNPQTYETSPPYPVRLDGIEVRIRCYDPTAKQVRQITVRHGF
jgi:prepilin-type N-terminal cleavage/methylation domain-containing protein